MMALYQALYCSAFSWLGGVRSWMQFGFLWALLTILPTSSLIPLKQIAVEHRTYLPGVGLSLVLASHVFLGFGEA